MTLKAAARATRRRGAALEDAILEAAWSVLAERGYSGFTYEAVAARAETSRPVLYRRWPQRDELLLATIVRVWRSNTIDVPDTGHLRDDALTLLRRVNAGRAHVFTVLSVQLLDYFRDTGTSFEDLRHSLVPRDEPPGFELVVRRAVVRGEIPDIARPKRVVDLPLDLVRHDMLMTMKKVPDRSLVQIVDDVWLPLLGATPARGR